MTSIINTVTRKDSHIKMEWKKRALVEKNDSRANFPFNFWGGLFLPLLLAFPSSAGAAGPFPIGYGMASQGAIIETEGVSGRQPWVSSAYYRDTLRLGASAAAVSYHGGGAAARYAFGGFGAFDIGPFGGGQFGPVVCKISIAQFDAMEIYYERDALLSAGTSWRFLSLGLDIGVRRMGLRGSDTDYRTSAAFGGAVHARLRRVSAGVEFGGLTVSTSGDRAADPIPTVSMRVCTIRNRYGSQGAMISITPAEDAPLRFVLAQEYRIGGSVALTASIASNPTTIGFGITADKSVTTGSAAVVNHPFLGWSKGVSVDYGK